MADRIVVMIAVPRDDALPLDVQGVNLRRKAIDLMQEVAKVSESSVRYKGATDDATVDVGDEVGMLSTWQHNLLAVRFIADGQVHQGICGPVVHHDPVTRTYSVTGAVRGEFN